MGVSYDSLILPTLFSLFRSACHLRALGSAHLIEDIVEGVNKIVNREIVNRKSLLGIEAFRGICAVILKFKFSNDDHDYDLRITNHDSRSGGGGRGRIRGQVR